LVSGKAAEPRLLQPLLSQNNYNQAMKRYLVWLPALLWAGFIFFVSAQPKEAFERFGLTGLLLTTMGHLITYAVLMLFVSLALHYGSKIPTRFVLVTAFVVIALYGLTDEYHQSFVPGRTPTLIDWLVDLAGAAVVWLFLAWRGFPRQPV
jgi:VanZ family protein